MWKAVIVMFLGTIVASVGDGLLSKGLRDLQQLEWPAGFWCTAVQYVRAAIHRPGILLGVMCHAFFFATILIAFSWGDLSLVLPITAFTYVFAPFIAHYCLNENVHLLRWLGAVIIVIGVVMVLLGEVDGLSLQKSGGQTAVHREIKTSGLSSMAREEGRQ